MSIFSDTKLLIACLRAQKALATLKPLLAKANSLEKEEFRILNDQLALIKGWVPQEVRDEHERVTKAAAALKTADPAVIARAVEREL